MSDNAGVLCIALLGDRFWPMIGLWFAGSLAVALSVTGWNSGRFKRQAGRTAD